MSDLLVYAVFGLSVVVAAQILFHREMDWPPKKTEPKQDSEAVHQDKGQNKGTVDSKVSASFDEPLWQSLDERLAERRIRFPYKG